MWRRRVAVWHRIAERSSCHESEGSSKIFGSQEPAGLGTEDTTKPVVPMFHGKHFRVG